MVMGANPSAAASGRFSLTIPAENDTCTGPP